MYIAKVPNRSSPPAYLIRESVRKGDQVTTRTIANITDWAPERRLALERCLKGDFDQVTTGADNELHNGNCFGVLYAIKSICDRLGITEILGDDRRGKLALLLVLARVAHQGSRLSIVRWSRYHALRETIGLAACDEDDLYDALDFLDDRHTAIEDALYRRHVHLGGIPPALVLYDVTSSYFEGQDNELAEYGYNRDGKRGKKQIVIGLLTDPNGEPLSVSIFTGSTADPLTVATQVETLKTRFGITKVLFVGDRGMVKAHGKENLSAAGYCALTALTDPQVRKLLRTGIIQLAQFKANLHEIENDGKRLVLVRNEETLRLEQHRRKDKIASLKARIEIENTRLAAHPKATPEAACTKLTGWAKRHRITSFITVVANTEKRTLGFSIDQQCMEKDGELDGCFVLETDIAKETLVTEGVRDRYMDLTKVERDFRCMKTGLLKVRPIFLRNAARTRAHVLVTVLALKVAREMERCLVSACGTTHQDPSATTLPDALESLQHWCFIALQGKSGMMTVLPRLDEQQQRIIEALKIPVIGKTRVNAAHVGRQKKRKNTP